MMNSHDFRNRRSDKFDRQIKIVFSYDFSQSVYLGCLSFYSKIFHIADIQWISFSKTVLKGHKRQNTQFGGTLRQTLHLVPNLK